MLAAIVNHPSVFWLGWKHASAHYFLGLCDSCDTRSQSISQFPLELFLQHFFCWRVLLLQFLRPRSKPKLANALWVKPCWKVELEEFTKIFLSGPIFMNLNYFRQNIWRLSSVQFHFWYVFGTSRTQPTAEEGFRIESVSIQAGCRKDVNEMLRTSWM